MGYCEYGSITCCDGSEHTAEYCYCLSDGTTWCKPYDPCKDICGGCPSQEAISASRSCSFKGTCNYGTEMCCDGSVHDAIECQCGDDGRTVCGNANACDDIVCGSCPSEFDIQGKNRKKCKFDECANMAPCDVVMEVYIILLNAHVM